ncbi:MAG: SDR family oxidoreductase [Ornithinimicrobium sp.]
MTQPRAALVTGGARGVGRAIALRLARDVDIVVINYFRSPQEARTTVNELGALGVQAHAIRASVAQQEQRTALFGEVAERVGHLDILINSAADGALVPVPDVDDKDLDRAFSTVVKGALGCSLLAADLMQEGGAIVNVSTLGGGNLVMANYLACAPAKAGLEALTRYLAVELAPKAIRVNTAAAGMLQSSVAHQFPDAGKTHETVMRATPWGRLGTPEELAEVVAFLASPAAGWVTGQTLTADGGMSTGAAMLGPTDDVGIKAEIRETSSVGQLADLQENEAEPADRVQDRDTTTTAGDSADANDRGPAKDDIVIVGMGLAVPGANSPAELADLLDLGTDMMTPIPTDRWDNDRFWTLDGREEDKTYSQHSGFLTDFRPHPRLAAELGADRASGAGPGPVGREYTTLWLRHSLLQALDGVQLGPQDRCSFIVGYTADGSQHLEEATVRAALRARLPDALARLKASDHEAMTANSAIESMAADRYPRGAIDAGDLQPHRVAEQAMEGVLPDGTETLMVDTACSSSLYALDIALLGLREGRCEIAVCGGSFAVGPRGSVLFAKLNGLSRSGQVRSLDAEADGVLFSDGAGVVVLKTRRRAEADGDTVLATVMAFGASSDGKGKAIYAPSPAGQSRAVARAFADPGAPARPDWVVAHATGTPAGDHAELTTLSEHFGPGDPVLVTSNKSVVGHTGWAAGVVSVVQAVEAMRRESISGQAQFTARRQLSAPGDALTVPIDVVPWRASEGQRSVAISGFGFGGTNAHLVLGEATATTQVVPPPLADGGSGEPAIDRIVAVGVATHLPGQADTTHATVTGPARFGGDYPLPPFSSVRMPPGTLRSIDRCQLMVLQCAARMLEQLSGSWETLREGTGVIMGHGGATRNAMLYATRCYADDLRFAARMSDYGLSPLARQAIDAVIDEVSASCPPSSEDTFPGMMPNVIAARVANYFDLHGPNMTVDAGLTSSVAAIDVAMRYLRAGRMDLALVGGINGNTTPEATQLLADVLSEGSVLAEGCFMVALTTQAHADRLGLPVLAGLDVETETSGEFAADAVALDCGSAAEGRDTCYLGGEGLREVVDVLVRPGPVQSTRVVCHPEPGRSPVVIRVEPPVPDPVDRVDQPTVDVVRRWEVSMQTSTVPWATQGSWWPDPLSTVLLTDDTAVMEGLDPPAGTLVLGLGLSADHVPDGVIPLPAVEEATLRQAVGERSVRHVRVVSRLPLHVDLSESTLGLHDACFLLAKLLAESGQDPDAEQGPREDGSEASFHVLLLNAARDGRPHPSVGLFTGLLKVVRLEEVARQALVVATDSHAVAEGIDAASRESASAHPTPLVLHWAGKRFSPALREGVLSEPASAVEQDQLVVAVGGGRGITAELLVALAAKDRPRIVLLGSNPLAGEPELLALPEDEFARARSGFINRRRAEDPELTVAAINAEFQRIGQARTVISNLDRMRVHCGRDRVHYVTCDVTDQEAVDATIAHVFDQHGSIDVLIHAAGVNRSAPLVRKELAEFRRIRDLKVRGHAHLAHAMADRAPGLWVNFGSLLGLTGQEGEADYAAANDFLGLAALARNAPERRETTVGWTLWGEVGLGANELTKAYFDKSGLYSSMSTEEGIRHFLRELGQGGAISPYTVHLGEPEEKAVRRLVPGLLEATPASRGSFYVDQVVEERPDRIVLERQMDEERDFYLQGHLVEGRPTLPGAFVAQFMVEAAHRLRPDLVATAIADMTFHRFLKVGQRSATKRIVSEIVDRFADGGINVSIRVSEDIVAPNGQVLVTDRIHFTGTVELRPHARPLAMWQPPHEAGAVQVPDPYHAQGSPVALSAEFRSTSNTRWTPTGARSRYACPVPIDHPVYQHFDVPVLLLDGLLRTGVLEVPQSRLVPVCAPLRIGRLELFGTTNDSRLAGSEVHLFATGPSPTDAASGGDNRFVAAHADGRVVLQVLDLDWVLLGYIDTNTGEFVDEGRARIPTTTGDTR